MIIYYLTKDDVQRINRKIVSRTEWGYNYEGGIDFTLSNVKTLYEKLPIRDAIIGKCAYQWYQIASNQYFTNGNKTTGYIVADTFLRNNTFKLLASEDEKFFVSVAIATYNYTIDNVRQFIAKSLKQVSENKKL